MRRALAACLVTLVLPSSAFAAGTVSRPSPTSSPLYTNAAAADVVLTDALDGTGGFVVAIAEPGISITGPLNGCSDNGNFITCTFPADEDPHVSATLSAQTDRFDASALTLSTVTVFSGAILPRYEDRMACRSSIPYVRGGRRARSGTWPISWRRATSSSGANARSRPLPNSVPKSTRWAMCAAGFCDGRWGCCAPACGHRGRRG